MYFLILNDNSVRILLSNSLRELITFSLYFPSQKDTGSIVTSYFPLISSESIRKLSKMTKNYNILRFLAAKNYLIHFGDITITNYLIHL